jgi:signal transduction histidine kinase
MDCQPLLLVVLSIANRLPVYLVIALLLGQIAFFISPIIKNLGNIYTALNWLHYSLGVAGIVGIGWLLRRFWLKLKWVFTSEKLLRSLIEVDSSTTPEQLIEQTLRQLQTLAGADWAVALEQLDEVTAKALVCLPSTLFPDQLTTPKIFAEALAQNCCLFYPDVVATSKIAPILAGQGIQSLVVLPLQDSSQIQGAILLMWNHPTKVSSSLNMLLESVRGTLQTLLRFQYTTFHYERLQARYCAILETITQGIVFIDESGEQGWINQAAADQLGLEPGAVEPACLAQSMALLRTQADNPEILAQQAMKFFSQPHAEIRDWVWLFQEQHKVLSLSSTPTRVRDVPGRLWVFDEITEQYFGRLALVKRTEQLELVNQELEAFAHTVAHDLRAPLASIDAFSLLLVYDCAETLDEEGQDNLQNIRTAVTRMRQLIDDLLQLAKVSRTEMKRDLVDLTSLAKTVIDMLQKTQPQRQVELKLMPEVTAKADTYLMQIVLENLLGNAWKYTSKKPYAIIEFGMISEPALKAQSTPNRSVDYEEFALYSSPIYFVKDNGAGFDMTRADKLFKTFERLHSKSEFDGTGVGLATVQRIIHRHGGKIWAEAEIGQGSTFYFTLPNSRAISIQD